MAELVSLYAGLKAGKLRKQALKREAKRHGPEVSVSEMVWDFLKKYGSEKLKIDLAKADKIEAE